MSKVVILLFTALLITLVTSFPTSDNEASSTASSDPELLCKSLCKLTKDYTPLCGKDGKTYPNRNALDCRNKCAHEQGKPEIEAAHDGKCPTDRPKTSVPRLG